MISNLIEKIISLILAILLPFFSISPIVVQPDLHGSYAEAISAATTAELLEENCEPIKVWDVSATENDNVTMSFYSDNTDSILEELLGRITLFSPITAYAATVELLPDNNDGEFGNNSGEQEGRVGEDATITGTVIVSGEGQMEENVYNHFVDINKYVNTVVSVIKDLYDIDVIPEYEDCVTDLVELDAVLQLRIADTEDEYFYIDDAVREYINPTQMLKFSPTVIYIDDEVENISDFAFTFCSDVEEIILPDTVTEIGNYAFAYCENLNTVLLSNNLERIGDSAFMFCTSLKELFIPASVTKISAQAFINLAPGSTITCATPAVRALINNGMITRTNTKILIAEQ